MQEKSEKYHHHSGAGIEPPGASTAHKRQSGRWHPPIEAGMRSEGHVRNMEMEAHFRHRRRCSTARTVYI